MGEPRREQHELAGDRLDVGGWRLQVRVADVDVGAAQAVNGGPSAGRAVGRAVDRMLHALRGSSIWTMYADDHEQLPCVWTS